MKIRIRRIMIPVLFCLAVACLIEIPMAGSALFGDDVILWDTLFRAAAAVPVLLYFYREDSVFRTKPQWGKREMFLCAISGAVLSLLSGLCMKAAGSADYEAVLANLRTGTVWLELVVLLAVSPLLEELFFRGVLYQRLKELFSPACSAVISAALFGLYHGNLSQGVYGFFMGLLLAYAMEKCQTVQAPVVFHIAANLSALLFSS